MELYRQRALIGLLLVVGIIIAGFFGLRTLQVVREFRGQRPPPFPPRNHGLPETNVDLIRDWMTVPYISKSYQLSSELLYNSLGIPARGNQDKSLRQLNEEYFPHSEGLVIDKIKAAVQANQITVSSEAPTVISPATAPPVQP